MDWQLVLILASPILLGIGTMIYFRAENKRHETI